MSMKSVLSGWGWWRKRPVAVEAQPAEEQVDSLYLRLGADGWESMRVISGEEPLFASWDGLHLEEMGWKRVLAVAQKAIAANADVLRQVKEIHLMVDDIGAEFTDDRSLDATVVPDKIRDFGEVFLNSRSVCYGRAAFAVRVGEEDSGEEFNEHQEERARYYHGFCDVVNLRELLALFDANGVKVVEVVPTPHVWVSMGMREERGVFVVVSVGAEQTTISLVNHQFYSVVVRSLAVGVVTLARGLEKEQQLTRERALAALREMDLLAELPPTLTPSPHEAAALGDYERAISAGLRNQGLLKFVRESLDYFAIQCGLGLPRELWLSVDVRGGEPIKGLAAWLERGLGISCQLLRDSSLYQMAKLPVARNCNLMFGAHPSQPLLIVDRKPYYYTEKGLSNDTPLQRQRKVGQLVAQSAASRGTRRRGGGSSSPRFPTGRRSRERAAAEEADTLVQRLSRWLGRDSATSGGGGQLAEEDTTADNRSVVLIFVMMALLSWLGWERLSKESKRYHTKLEQFLTARTERTTKMEQVVKQTVISSGRAEDKVYWTEKIIHLSKAMNLHIWLSDIFMKAESKSGEGGQELVINKLVINGSVYPSTDGHIGQVADFASRLYSSKGFMRDLQYLGFGSAKLNPGTQIVDFTLEAVTNSQLKLSEKSGGGSGEMVGMEDMHQNISKHNAALEKSISR